MEANPQLSPATAAAMRRALDLAATPGIALGPNPRVGCVLLGPESGPKAGAAREILGEGFHQGAGTPHAEVAALADYAQRAGSNGRHLPTGSTAVVTLEPCNHTGRTGPCTTALIDAGVARVIFAQADPNPIATGGARRLREAGIEVLELAAGDEADRARQINRGWTHGLVHGRPFVTWKFATSLDGRSAASDGTSRWISSPAARRDTHRLRGECDVMLVGSGTVAIDDPELTVRDRANQPLPHQPLRVVMGERVLPPQRRIFNHRAETLHLRTRDPHTALADLFERGKRHAFLEGGPTLAAAFLRAGLVDEVVTYVAPMLLGAGRSAVGDLGIDTITDARHLRVVDVVTLAADNSGDDSTGADINVRLTLAPRKD